jgi:hypothetical protein
VAIQPIRRKRTRPRHEAAADFSTVRNTGKGSSPGHSASLIHPGDGARAVQTNWSPAPRLRTHSTHTATHSISDKAEQSVSR